MSQSVRNFDILNIKDLCIERGGAMLLSHISISLFSGDIIWVNGSNGIGKTSLLMCCAGLLRPNSGEITWNGQDVHKLYDGHIAYLGHQDTHKPELSVQENLQFWQDLYSNVNDIRSVLEQVGLWQRRNQRAKSLSAGQSRRLSLARLIISNAKLWILDEPAAAMDAKGRDLIHHVLKTHVTAQGCALLASHHAPKRIGKNTRILTLTAPHIHDSESGGF